MYLWYAMLIKITLSRDIKCPMSPSLVATQSWQDPFTDMGQWVDDEQMWASPKSNVMYSIV